MLNPKNFLTVISYEDGEYTNHTKVAGDYLRGGFDYEIEDANYVYVGFYKPVHSFYVEVSTPSDTASNLIVEIYNGSTWVSANAHDDTNAFSRSGFIQVAQDSKPSLVEINGKSKHFYRLSTSGISSSVTIQGLGLVFSDDQALSGHLSNSSRFRAKSVSSYIAVHLVVRDEIIQRLTNVGKLKITASGEYERITPYDLLDLHEIKLAATYGAIAKILMQSSDEPNDTWDVKSKHFERQYEQQLKDAQLTLDKNDNGVIDRHEKPVGVKTYFIGR